MKLKTHIIFSMAVALWFATTWQAVVLSPITTYLIDAIGHSRRHGMPRRTWVTHDWVLSMLTLVLPLSWLYTLIHIPLTTALIINAATLYSHLALDAVTGHTFIATRKIGHAIFEWDDPKINALFAALGAALIIALGYFKLHLVI
jgi:hypothetical protein